MANAEICRDGELLAILEHELSGSQLDAVLGAPGLAIRVDQEQWAREQVVVAAREYRLARHLDTTRLLPFEDAKRARNAASAVDRALGTLTDDGGILRGDFMVWVGDAALRASGPPDGTATHAERAGRVVEALSDLAPELEWLRDHLQNASRLLAGENSVPGARSLREARQLAIERLVRVFREIYGKRMGRGLSGPGQSFVAAFFQAVEPSNPANHPSNSTVRDLIRAAQENQAPQ